MVRRQAAPVPAAIAAQVNRAIRELDRESDNVPEELQNAYWEAISSRATSIRLCSEARRMIEERLRELENHYQTKYPSLAPERVANLATEHMGRLIVQSQQHQQRQNRLVCDINPYQGELRCDPQSLQQEVFEANTDVLDKKVQSLSTEMQSPRHPPCISVTDRLVI
jgi:hypothetical protein